MVDNAQLASLRHDFDRAGLSESDVNADPVEQFRSWLKTAIDSGIKDANAMTVSTVGADGRPSARVVLLKYFDADGFTFFTNYGSRKGRELDHNPAAEFHFFWPDLERQISIAGRVEKASHQLSEEYFLSRPLASRIGAWASQQSSEIASRKTLEERVEFYQNKFGEDVPLPDFWGGLTMKPDRFEFWQGRKSRLHDRLVYTLDGSGNWQIARLAP
ncbi:MAG: pyridoxamine 5'-phosphate oxidase [Acidobacteria bacterium ACB1]|nr:Pyridoxine/pyridoxamine 5'-phosphate oxidase [Pyrinomonadaceae bacterium]MCE7960916.1 pyridoxamine 5'-phosphate oxidase [Acidobacteria bacterium ACB1]RIJ89589.1 MAG: pyridoxamine 5'-phosphate oxidase [Acidobacteriota bacterium]